MFEMFILSSCKIKRSIQEHLRTIYSNLTFQFCSDMGEAKKFLPEADILLTYGEDLDDDLVQLAKKLKWIMVLSSGIDELPFEALKKREIIITNSRGIHKIPMAEYALSMLMQTTRKTKTLIEHEQKHIWDRTVKVNEISGRTITVVGTGSIGQEVARLAKAFNMNTIGVSRSGRAVEFFDEVKKAEDLSIVLEESDFIVSVLPSTEKTKQFYKLEHFKAMKEDAIFLNMGRGDAVADEVIIEAMNSQEIAHAILDVFNEEPLPEDHPFWEMENITVTPHLSGISPQYQPRAFEIFYYNLEKYKNGEKDLKNLIDPTRGY